PLCVCVSLSLSLPAARQDNLHSMDNHSTHGVFAPKQVNASLDERSQRIKMAADMGLVRSSRGRHCSRALGRRLLQREGITGCGCKNAALSTSSNVFEDLGVRENEDDAAEIETRVRALQRLVPGGEELGLERLFEETADYIEALQGQVSAMRAMSCLLDGSERDKRMMGK
ncbi:unnamed protein product, partial [Musa textilis]